MKLTQEEKQTIIEAAETLLSRDYKSIQTVKIADKYVSIIFSDSLQKYIMAKAELDIKSLNKDEEKNRLFYVKRLKEMT